MAAFSAFADDSGTHDGALFTGMAGAIGGYTAWKIITKKWRRILDKHHISDFRAADLCNSSGEFKGWDEPARRLLVSELLTALTETSLIPVGSFVRCEDFEAAKNEVPGFKTLADEFCSDCLIRQIGYADIPKPVAITFERGRLAHSSFMCNFPPEERTKKKLDARLDRLGIAGIYFDKKQGVIPLQVADLIAYEIYRELLAREKNVHGPARYPLVQLFAAFPRWIGGIVEPLEVVKYFREPANFYDRISGATINQNRSSS